MIETSRPVLVEPARALLALGATAALAFAASSAFAQAPVTTPDGRPAAGVPGAPTSSPAGSGVLPGTGAAGTAAGRDAGAPAGDATVSSPGPLIRDAQAQKDSGSVDAGAAAARPGAPLKKDVPFVPTSEPVVAAMLKLANVKKSDVLYDLGCGDGRIVITAAKRYGVRGVGIDIDPERIAESRKNARAAGVDERVQFRTQNLFDAQIGDASVVTLYLLPTVNAKLKPKLLADLKPGTRIVSHAFDMGDWKPEKTVEVDGTRIFLWTVPERSASLGAPPPRG